MSFKIYPLSKDYDRNAFDCGNAALNDYLKYQASQDVKKDLCSCFLAIEQDTEQIAGFYTLTGWSILFEDLPSEVQKKLPRYPAIPAALIGRLAVDKSVQGRGLGTALLGDALDRALNSPVKVHSLILEAKDEELATWYEGRSFIRIPSKPLTLFLPLKTALQAREKSAASRNPRPGTPNE